MSAHESDLRTALFISGGGTTAEAVIRACNRGEIKGINPVAMISSRASALGLLRARALGIPTTVVERTGKSLEEFGEQLQNVLEAYGVDFIAQLGWLPFTPGNITETYRRRVINQHPGMLSGGTGLDFGGKGMYGSRVTAAALAYAWASNQQAPRTGSTMHYVSSEVDGGLLIRVSAMGIPTCEKPVTIAEFRTEERLRQHLVETTLQVQSQLLPVEHENVIQTLNLFGAGNEVSGWSRTPDEIVPKQMAEILCAAKELGIEVFPNG